MGKEIIKYHNDMNKVSFAGFKEKELDLFFSICQKMKDKGTNEIVFSFSDLRKLSQYSNRSIERFYSDLDRVYKKMLELNLKYEDEKEIRRFVLFSRYIIKKDEQIIIIKASEDFEYILNKLIGTFTKFDLVDFVSLKSVYSKNMFKLLKQWESKKNVKYEVQVLREILGVPSKYTTSNFNDRVLKPIMDELPKYFNDLCLEKLKTGKKVTHLKFTWSSRKEEIKEAEKIEVEISEKLDKVIKKGIKNRFLAKLLTINNIEKLLKIFEENDLIKGLLWAYKEVRQDISTLEYLIKTIRTGIEKKEKKIIVKPTEKIEDIFDKTFEEIPLNFEEETIKNKNQEIEIPIIKEKVTIEQYEELYKKYLEENNTTHNPFIRKAFDISNKNKYEIIENNDDDKNPPLPPIEELSEKSQNEAKEYARKRDLKEQYMNEIHEIAKEVRKYIVEQKLEIRRLSSNILSRKINQKKINQYQEENEFLEQLVCEFGMWGVRLTTYTGYELLGEVEKRFNESIAETVEIFNLIFERMEIEKRLDKEFFENMIADCIDTKYSLAENISTSELKKRFSLADISEDKLLSKTGKKLVGGALISRLEKIAKEEKIEIEYKGKIII
ncbi:replication initiation protein [Candidatus Cetobacterium colombiensis]|uniref:Replication initiation protein n=1 Tax=Candidatus Cetobacterium colombiensis TaxID=3073100 RepID=A0ABU4WG30_9FUSO|nr:replication initiation protein [Candidatus Cetobacterium colombiensis]MDX8337433.1 replication initiation protein [Candidatus Cetobacterium colombiensis]